MGAELSNINHPEFGVVTIPLPIPKEQYDSCVELLESLEIGDASNRDCHLDELHSPWPVLDRLEGTQVNLDELDYLAKRLDGFGDDEVAQFQAMAEKLGLTSLKDLINLSFCCQQATVITDFSDLESVGRSHYMNLNGGCASLEELENVDGVESALLLIEGNQGVVTPYGVVYDNGMQLEQIYDGKHFPFYLYDDAVLSLGLISKGQPENTKKATWLYLPTTRKQLERGMLRSGIQDPEDMCFQVGNSEFPMEVDVALDFKQESIFDLNDLAWAVARLDRDNLQKLGAVVALAEPENASQIRCLAENLDLFQFAPGAHTPAEYGTFMIQQSGHFEYDPNLDEFYDYEKYGLQHMNQETGTFTDRGYVAYHGTVSLEVLMMGESHQEEQTFQMGGM
ncbi:antirestriction protein ArdA [Pseudoflavonifractor capillosus]|uniref:antirestriction protein ArdA n=1 Tax=Pseudoflavonifractor capillosus TaxID=106588 RepID=UPI0031F77E88